MEKIICWFSDNADLVYLGLIQVFLWIGTIWFQNYKSRRDARVNLFTNLISLRYAQSRSSIWIESLNSIEAVFHNKKQVIQCWYLYYESLHPDSDKKDNSNNLLTDLLNKMAKSLGYKNLQITLDKTYTPQAYLDYLNSQKAMQDFFLRLGSQKSQPDVQSCKEETYQKPDS